MTLYRRVAIEDGESAEPVQFVGVHPVSWPAGLEPQAAFVEIDLTDAGIVNHGGDRYEVQADGRRVAVFDRYEDAELFVAARDKLAAAEALAEALGAMYAYGYEDEIDLPTWKARFPNIAWTKREIKLAAQTALRQYREAGK